VSGFWSNFKLGRGLGFGCRRLKRGPAVCGLCLALALALLAGCGQAQQPAATTTSAAATESATTTAAQAEADSTTAAATEAAAAATEATTTAAEASVASDAATSLEPAEINWYVVNTPQPDTDMVLERVNQMLAERTAINTTLKLNVLDWGVFQDRINVMLQANEPIDLVFTCGWINLFTALAGRDALYPLDELLEQHGQDIYKHVPPKYFEATRVRGKIRAVPNYAGYPQIKGLDFRADLVDKHGFDYKSVTELAALEPYLQTIIDNEPGVTPFLPGVDSGITNFGDDGRKQRYDGLGGGVTYDILENRLISSLDTGDTLYARIHDWYTKGYIAKDAASRTVYGDEIKSGNYAVFFNSSYVDDGAKSTQDNGFPIYSMPFVTQGPITTGMVQVALTAIPATSPHPDRAMMLLNAMWAEQEIFNTLVYGIEGTHWSWNADKTFIVPAENNGYGSPISYELGGTFRKYPTESETAEVLAFQESLNESVPPSPLLGFSFDAEPVKNEWAQIDAIEQELGSLLYTGTADPDELIPQIRERREAAGWQTVFDEMQRQVDEWKAANGK
jgi:putative aldouronate transport system substrate-binding protein